MAKGDHIYVDTKWHLGKWCFIKHHGIDMGDGTVIHFFRESDEAPLVIAQTPMKDFKNGKEFSIVRYNACVPPDEVVWMAERILMIQKEDQTFDYKFRRFNCEHFATLCKTGRSRSKQAETVQNLQTGTSLLILMQGQGLSFDDLSSGESMQGLSFDDLSSGESMQGLSFDDLSSGE